MRVYSVEKVISENRTMQLDALPFPPGELVDVIVLARKKSVDRPRVHTLKAVYQVRTAIRAVEERLGHG